MHTFLWFLEIRICVRNLQEQSKCEWLQAQVAAKNYPTSVTTRAINAVTCVLGVDNYDCLEKIEANEADIINLDAGTAYYASINFVSRFLSSERYPENGESTYIFFNETSLVTSEIVQMQKLILTEQTMKLPLCVVHRCTP